MIARSREFIHRQRIDLMYFSNLKPTPQDMLLRCIFDKAPPARNFIDLLEETEKQEQIVNLHTLPLELWRSGKMPDPRG